MAFPDRKTINVLLTTLLFTAVLAVIYLARKVLIIFCFAVLFAYLVDPIVSFLDRRTRFRSASRGPHIAETYVGLLILVGLTLFVVAPEVSRRPGAFVRNLTSISDRLATGEIATQVGQANNWNDSQTIRIREFLIGHREMIQRATKQVQNLAATALGAGFVIPILAIFFLADGRRLAVMTVEAFATEKNRWTLEALSRDLNNVLHQYIRAKMILVSLSFTYALTALFLLRFPHALALGILAGALEFVPIAGWITAASTITVVGIVTHSHWIWMSAVLGIWRVLVDYWIAPRVLGHELDFHPIVAIFVLMVGGAVGGLVGAYLAVPVAAMARAGWRVLGESKRWQRPTGAAKAI